jgi:transposase-like protein
VSLHNISKFIEKYGIDRSQVAIHDWIHKADLQPRSTVTEDQLSVDEKMIRVHGQQFWLYGAVDPFTNETLHVGLYPIANQQTTRLFLTSYIGTTSSMTLNSLSMTRIFSDQFSLKTAIDFKSFDMEIGMLSNVSFEK